MIEHQVTDRVAKVLFRRPDEGNALTGEMIRQLGEVFSQTSPADIVTITGEGRDFCVGRDRQEAKSVAPYDAFSLIADVNTRMSEFPGVIISAVRGRAVGFGVGLVLRSDIAIAGEDAVFTLDEVSKNIPPMFILAAIGDHLPPKHALDAVLTSREINAAEALRMGLVSRVVPSADVASTLDSLVKELSTRDRTVLRACKRYFRAVTDVPSTARIPFALVEQTNFTKSQH